MVKALSDPLSMLDSEEQLQVRVAWHYYVGNLTQQEVASQFGLSRVRVNRLLAACRESGLVQISINNKLTTCVELEQKLMTVYGLRHAVVVPTPDDPATVKSAIGVGAGAYLSECLKDNMTIAIGWGRTLLALQKAIPVRRLKAVSVVSLLGGLSHCSRINTFEMVSDFADLIDADRHFFAAPIYASNERARDVFLAQDVIMETYEKARCADLAVLTVGDLSDSLIANYGLPYPDAIDSVREAGAVGDLLGYFIDARGEAVDHPLNRRTVALKLDHLRQIDDVFLISGGAHKVEVNRAALNGGYISVMVTDEDTARALV